MSLESPGVWEGVRRALGRLIGAVRVRDLPQERLTARAPVSPAEALHGPPCRAGAAERAWRPTAGVIAGRTPQAEPGAGGVDLATVTTVIGMNAALRPEAIGTFACPPLPTVCTLHRLGLGETLGVSAAAGAAALLPTSGRARGVETRLPAPGAARLPLDPPALPPAARPRRFGRPAAPADSWRLPGARVRTGAAMIGEVPMTRTRLPVPLEASVAERRRLAAATGAGPDDIALLGVFPQVPVAAVRRLALKEGGAGLLLWLKPEALSYAAAGKAPRLATLVIGRQRSTGKVVQTVL